MGCDALPRVGSPFPMFHCCQFLSQLLGCGATLPLWLACLVCCPLCRPASLFMRALPVPSCALPSWLYNVVAFTRISMQSAMVLTSGHVPAYDDLVLLFSLSACSAFLFLLSPLVAMLCPC